MRNCLILGCGRSGTSMVAGTLAKAGYFMGDNLYSARPSNPKGFFEDQEINGINEAILAQVLRKRPNFWGRWFFRSRPLDGQRWLATIPLGTSIPCQPALGERIKRLTSREPYCFKDTRFSYTLPVWRPLLKNVVFIAVFRDPASTALSILKECKDVAHLHNLRITFDRAIEIWTLMYTHILEIHRHEGSWLFLHYDQVVSGKGLTRLQAFVDAPVDRSFPELSFHRSFSRKLVPEKVKQVYEQLCELAEYERPDQTRQP
jgi:hypothetical protein